MTILQISLQQNLKLLELFVLSIVILFKHNMQMLLVK